MENVKNSDKILIVDDDSVNRNILKELLEDDFNLFMAQDGLRHLKG
jgi:CheY-like chemotaxis protein